MKRLFCVLLISVANATSHSQIRNEDSLYSQAVTFWDYAAIDSATYTLRRLLQLYPNSAKGLNLLGAILKDQGEYQQAIEMFRRSIQADSTELNVYRNLGNAYIDQGELDSAIAIHRVVISKDSTRADAHNDLGDAYMKKGDIAYAGECFRKATQLDPHYTLARRNLGVAYMSEGKYREAIDELFLVRNMDGFYPDLHHDLTRVAKAAESEFEQWVERQPNNGEAHYYYSFFLYHDDEVEKAVDELGKAIAIDSRQEKYYNVKALWLWNLNKCTNAVEDCKKCLELNPNSWMCHHRIAFCFMNIHDISGAIAHFKRAVEIDSLVIESQFSLGEAYAVAGQYEKAIDPLNRALSLGHMSPWADFDLAICYHELDRNQLALRHLMSARKRNMNSPIKGMDSKIMSLYKEIKAMTN